VFKEFELTDRKSRGIGAVIQIFIEINWDIKQKKPPAGEALLEMIRNDYFTVNVLEPT